MKFFAWQGALSSLWWGGRLSSRWTRRVTQPYGLELESSLQLMPEGFNGRMQVIMLE